MRNQKNSLIWLAVVIGVAGAGAVVFNLTTRNDSFQKLPEFPVAEYRQGDPLWSNSHFRLVGTLDNIILESINRENYLVVIKASDTGAPLPVIIPSNLPKSPLQRQQNLALKVSVDSSGRIVASECRID